MSVNTAGYPTWDGFAGTNRESREQDQGAWDYEDYDQLAAEILAHQAVLQGGSPLFGDVEIDGALNHDGTTVGFYGATPSTQLTVTGSAAANAALVSLLAHLDTLGLIVDSSS
jgi:hypothetical protein